MAILTFILSFILLAAGLASAYMSLDLVPTSPGLVYAFAGTAAVVGSAIVFALGVLAVRVAALTRAVRERPAASGLAAPVSWPVEGEAEPAASERPESKEVEAAAAVEDDAPAAESGAVEPAPAAQAAPEAQEAAAPDLATPEAGEDGDPLLAETPETPEGPPTLIGRYASSGANYMIFSDGSIEAETTEGAFKFASMGDFKEFLKDRREPGA